MLWLHMFRHGMRDCREVEAENLRVDVSDLGVWKEGCHPGLVRRTHR